MFEKIVSGCDLEGEMIGIPLGLAISNVTEWVVHKYVLHRLGKNKSSYWSFHWHTHHRNCRKNDNFDFEYEKSLLDSSAHQREVFPLICSSILVAPLFPVAPFFTGTLWYCAFNYYRKHKHAHTDVEWGKQNLPWHYDHHMGKNQDANWCVTKPWFDHLMKTREPYLGTLAEIKMRERKQGNKKSN